MLVPAVLALSTSPGWNPLAMVTVAPVRLVPSKAPIVGSSTAELPGPAAKLTLPLATTVGSACTSTVLVWVALTALVGLPSVTDQEMVRVRLAPSLLGLGLVERKVMLSS